MTSLLCKRNEDVHHCRKAVCMAQRRCFIYKALMSDSRPSAPLSPCLFRSSKWWREPSNPLKPLGLRLMTSPPDAGFPFGFGQHSQEP